MRVYPDLTPDGEFQRLGNLGYSGALNDRQFAFLRANLYSGALPDMFRQSVVNPAANRNLLSFTEQFNNTYWLKSNATVSPDAQSAPNGTTTADRITASSTIFANVGGAATLVAATNYTLSAYIRTSTSNASRLALFDVTGNNIEARVDFSWSSGVPSTASTSGSAANIAYVNCGDGWWRVSLRATSDAVNTSHRMLIYPDVSAGTGSVFVWGAQLETGSTATAYQVRTV